jgi:amino acid permease
MGQVIAAKELISFAIMGGIQVTSSAITATNDASNAADRYKNNCKRIQDLQQQSDMLKSYVQKLNDASLSQSDIETQLANMRDATNDILSDTRQQKRSFLIKAAIVVVTCVVMTLIAVFIIIRRSSALQDKLTELSARLPPLEGQ